MAIGSVAQEIVRDARLSTKVLNTRSPVRSSAAEREQIRDTFIQGRLDAYPLGLERDD
jgi:hypothetical protein